VIVNQPAIRIDDCSVLHLVRLLDELEMRIYSNMSDSCF
jgi:hypothetical protein